MTSDTLALTRLDGTDASLEDYAGQAVLVVNVASKCGFTRQYAGLEALYERYRDRGFTSSASPATSSAARSRAAPRRSPSSAP